MDKICHIHVIIFCLVTILVLSANAHSSRSKVNQTDLLNGRLTSYDLKLINDNDNDSVDIGGSEIKQGNLNDFKLTNLTDLSEISLNGNGTNGTQLTPTFIHGLTCLKIDCPSCDEYDRWFFRRLWWLLYPVVRFCSNVLFVCVFMPLFIGFLFKELCMGMCRQRKDLKGKVALVTGGSRGVGFEVAKELAACGARVIITSRQGKRGAEAAKRIREMTGNRFVNNELLTLENFESVRKLAADFKRDNKVLDILVNNAGNFDNNKIVTHIRKCPFVYSSYLGHFLLTNLLVTTLKLSKYPIVINVTCSYQMFGNLAKLKGNIYQRFAYETHRNRSLDYQRSKLAWTMFSQEIAIKCPRINSYSANPGLLRTRSSFPTNIGKVLRLPRRSLPCSCALFCEYLILCFWGKSVNQGAQTVLNCIMNGKLENGAYFSNCRKSRAYEYAVKLICAGSSEKYPKIGERLWKVSAEKTKIEPNFMRDLYILDEVSSIMEE